MTFMFRFNRIKGCLSPVDRTGCSMRQSSWEVSMKTKTMDQSLHARYQCLKPMVVTAALAPWTVQGSALGRGEAVGLKMIGLVWERLAWLGGVT